MGKLAEDFPSLWDFDDCEEYSEDLPQRRSICISDGQRKTMQS